MIAITALLTLCVLSSAQILRLNVGGSEIVPGWRCDTGAYAMPNSNKFTSTRPIDMPGDLKNVYKSHRWVSTGDLEIKIPVPFGSYKVSLLFAETYSGSSLGFRMFKVKINNGMVIIPDMPTGTLDIFQMAGGFDKPYELAAGNYSPSAGFITVTLGRIAGKNNPMISGITIEGPNAAGSVGTEGETSCVPGTAPTTSGAPSPAVSPAVSAAVSAAASPAVASNSAPPPAPSTVPAPSKSTSALFLNVGSNELVAGWRCDTGAYAMPNSKKFTSTRPIDMLGDLKNVYKSHRWVATGNLELKIPVPAGTFTVSLLFAETYSGSSLGFRMFTVKINGEMVTVPGMPTGTLDIFEMAGGFDKPYELAAGTYSPSGGFITVTLGRITGKNNPMLSGVIIDGPNAEGLVGTEGETSCLPGPGVSASPVVIPSTSSAPSASVIPAGDQSTSPAPLPTMSPIGTASPAPTVTSDCSNAVDTTFSDLHFAHAVTGGPYVETDFQKLGYASVKLDGTLSHSHFQTATENGNIVTYKWMWQDSTNPNADAAGMVTVTTSKATQNFPLGVTTVTLLVIDQFCNPASDSTTVTVNSATLPGAYCYYYDLGSATPSTVSLPVALNTSPKPQYGLNVGDINFATTNSFGTFGFKANTFAVRCSFFIDVRTAGSLQYKVIHSGPVKIYSAGSLVGSSDSMVANAMTTTTSKNFAVGLHEWQILYLRPKGLQGTLKFQFATGAIIPADTVRHDSAALVPILTSLSSTSESIESIVVASGMSFVNGVLVKFGAAVAETVQTSATSIQLRVPAGTGTVPVTVTTNSGVSNSIAFTYKAAESFPVKFKEDTLKTTTGAKYELQFIAAIKYGPDGRLYCGATNSMIYALSLNKALQVIKKCEKNVFETWERAVLGLGFNPTSNALKLFFTANTLFWKKNKIIADDFVGWTNGKVKSVTMNGPTGCFNNDVADVVTGLPVGNHDHSVQAIQFLAGGKMVISIGGFTNGGISVPDDLLGGFPSNALAGAIVECPTTGTAMKYSDPNPFLANITSGACKTYATGFRNTFGMTLHSNGKLYATDNGPNGGFGEYSTDCVGGEIKATSKPDKLKLVQPGKCHGHPSIYRGLRGSPLECVFENPACVQPLVSNLQPSTNGIVEYRSNVFGNKAKGNLFLSKYTSSNEGRVSRVVLSGNGEAVATNGLTQVFHPKSGLAIVEGPRGELIMSRVFRKEFFVLVPDYSPVPTVPFFIGVLPRQGPAGGGTRTTITGHNFGAAPSATFGGKSCTSVQVVDDDSFSCVTPAGVAGQQVAVSVTGGGGGVAVGVGSDYWYF